MRALILAALLLVSPRAAAQSFRLVDGPLEADGVAVGTGVSASIALSAVSSSTPTRAHVRFVGSAITLEADVDLATAHVQAGVGRETRLSGTTFATWMSAGTWAPVLRMARGGVQIALPATAPGPRATLPSGASPATTMPSGVPWGSAGTVGPDDPSLHCGAFELRSRPGGTSWLVPGVATRTRVGSRAGWDTIRVEVDGFRYLGYRESGAACPPDDTMIGLSGFGVSAGDGFSDGRVVVLPAGTPLFATDVASHPFATLHVDAIGIERVIGVSETCDAAGRCARSPPLPTGPAQWIVQVDDPGGARFLLIAWVRAPAESLADAPGGSGGFGLGGAGGEWPSP